MRATCMVLALIALLPGARPVEAQTRPARPERPAQTAASARGWVGISFVEAGGRGEVVVRDVFPDSPADRAGIQEGDTLVMWNGRHDIARAVAAQPLRPGDTLRIRVRRGGERDTDVTVTAAQRPRALSGVFRRVPGEDVIVLRPGQIEREMRLFADTLAVRMDSVHRRLRGLLQDSLGPQLRALERDLPSLRVERLPGDAVLLDFGRRAAAGAEFAEVTDGLASYFGTDRGALVLRVAPGTPAARAGLREGDVVVAAGGQAVSTVADLRRAIVRSQQRDARQTGLTVVRKGKRHQVELRWE